MQEYIWWCLAIGLPHGQRICNARPRGYPGTGYIGWKRLLAGFLSASLLGMRERDYKYLCCVRVLRTLEPVISFLCHDHHVPVQPRALAIIFQHAKFARHFLHSFIYIYVFFIFYFASISAKHPYSSFLSFLTISVSSPHEKKKKRNIWATNCHIHLGNQKRSKSSDSSIPFS